MTTRFAITVRLVLPVLALAISGAPVALAQESKTVRLLTVGNSFAENALVFLPKIAESAGHKLIFAKANLGGCSLERHWNHVVAYEANHDDAAGRPYGTTKKSLYELLKQDRWEVVTIQQQSLASCDPKTFLPYAVNLHEYIAKHCPGAKILAHQTWAYRVDDPLFRPAGAAKSPRSHREMYEQTRAAYRQIADQLKIGLIPSGEAMFKADTDPKWGYRPDTSFDFAKAKAPPTLPVQEHSLHAGWGWRKNKKDTVEKLGLDGHHANIAGQYLIACVWYEVLFKDDVTKVGFVPKEVDAEYGRFLRATAHEAVAELSKPQAPQAK